MGKNKDPQIVLIDGKEYDLSDFNPEQRLFLDHCMDLDKKLASCQFQFDQLRVGKDAFLAMLKNSLQQSAATSTVDEKEETPQES
jgi:cytochrome b involved in lipid metabolism